MDCCKNILSKIRRDEERLKRLMDPVTLVAIALDFANHGFCRYGVCLLALHVRNPDAIEQCRDVNERCRAYRSLAVDLNDANDFKN